jgi:hypothetical protein
LKRRKKLIRNPKRISQEETTYREGTGVDWGKKQENLQSNKTKRLNGMVEGTIVIGPVRGREDDGDEPEVREDEVEDEDVARVRAEDEGEEEERYREDGLIVT